MPTYPGSSAREPSGSESVGTEKSPGTAVFALTGMVNRTGLIEVPMGITLREIIYDIGGGIPNDKKFKAVQTGGPLGGCLPEKDLDIPVDFDSLQAAGSVMGSGGMIIADESTCMVEFAKYLYAVRLRRKLRQMPALPHRQHPHAGDSGTHHRRRGRTGRPGRNPAAGQGHANAASLCALGQLAPAPVMSTLLHFEDEYRAHIQDERCPAGKCRALITFEIIADLCTGCTVCGRNCASNAISGEKRQPHVIDQDLCERCGMCKEVCKFDAIVVHIESVSGVSTMNVTLTINGKTVTAPEGSTISGGCPPGRHHTSLPCATIPTLSNVGACRMCVVSVERARTLQTACTTPVAEGMVVDTESQEARETRKFVLEMLLTDHPNDCMTCEVNGDCELQDLVYDYGVAWPEHSGARHDYADRSRPEPLYFHRSQQVHPLWPLRPGLRRDPEPRCLELCPARL